MFFSVQLCALSVREVLDALERGEVLGIALEGTRARGPYALQRGKNGVAYLAARADVPIVPAGQVGRTSESASHLTDSSVVQSLSVGFP